MVMTALQTVNSKKFGETMAIAYGRKINHRGQASRAAMTPERQDSELHALQA
jgi:hypothetical protein